MKLDLEDGWPSLIVVGCLGVIGVFVVAALIATLPVYLIWNHVLVDVFPGLHALTLGQAFCVSLFMRCFGSSSTSAKS